MKDDGVIKEEILNLVDKGGFMFCEKRGDDVVIDARYFMILVGMYRGLKESITKKDL